MTRTEQFFSSLPVIVTVVAIIACLVALWGVTKSFSPGADGAHHFMFISFGVSTLPYLLLLAAGVAAWATGSVTGEQRWARASAIFAAGLPPGLLCLSLLMAASDYALDFRGLNGAFVAAVTGLLVSPGMTIMTFGLAFWGLLPGAVFCAAGLLTAPGVGNKALILWSLLSTLSWIIMGWLSFAFGGGG